MSSTQKSTEVTTDSLQDGQATISSPVNTVEKKNVTNEPQQHPSNTSSKTVPSLTLKEATSSKAEAEPLISSSSPPKSSNIQNTNPFRRSSIFEPLQKSSILPEEPALYNNSAIKRNERILRCEQRILSNEWDTKAWLGILKESLSSSVDTGRFYFDCFFRRFPLSPCKLKEYIDFELQRGNVGVVQNIFQKHLKSSANIELWRCYLHFVDTQNEGLEQMEYRAVMLKAFNFALENVSIDISSTVIYRDYIEFIKKWKPEVAFDESQKILMLRQIYHEAIKNPIYQLEALWSEYEAFERGVGGQILMERKFREELTASYMLARSALVERTSRLEKIVRNVLSVPVADSAKERQQVKLWKEYIDWEKKNSLKLDLKDLQKRVIFTYKQCLQCYSFHSDIWLQYASFLDGQHDACAAVFQQALQINPTSFLIAFSYAEYEERHGNNELAKNIYENLAARNDIDPTLVYVQFMKFAKRVYGMDKVREIFRGARKDGRCTYHIWIANASLEHHFGKAEFANKVFALGRQKCATDKEFLFKYIDYLAFYKCHNEIEVLYRQMLRTFSPVHLDEIWSRYMRFVVNHFPLQIINRVEKALFY
ncbi:uncharacterized protein LOC135146418 [Zophobas morio]|uniref:uncharacterized protein LOC135146418 n=1 Tax=Zophobas morio TaxID=2755281 RepID=UPI0030833164